MSPGPGLASHRRRRSRARRLPGTAAVVGLDTPVRVHRGRRASWLPQPAEWAAHTAAALDDDPDGMLALYRAVLGARHRLLPQLSAQLDWHDTGRQVLDLSRGDALRCVVNFGDSDLPLPEGRILVASLPGILDTLPPDAAVWLGPLA
ncbi:MAG: DUF3459 domain-containing protein [Kineosporiaceae bacterium]